MNIRIEIIDTHKPYAVIYTNKITPEVQQAVSLLDTKSELITANDDEKIIIINRLDIPEEDLSAKDSASGLILRNGDWDFGYGKQSN